LKVGTFSVGTFSIATAWAYPALIGVAFYFRRRSELLIWLPGISLLAMLVQ